MSDTNLQERLLLALRKGGASVADCDAWARNYRSLQQQLDDAQRTLDSVIAAKNAIEQQRDEALAVLNIVKTEQRYDRLGDAYWVCACCGEDTEHPHAANCRLAALLKGHTT